MIFHSADEVIERTNGYYFYALEAESVPGQQTEMPIVVNNVDQVEGYGCLSLTVPEGIFNAYLSLRANPQVSGVIDLSTNPKLKIRVMQRGTPSPREINVGITTRYNPDNPDDVYSNWQGHPMGEIGLGMVLGQWAEFEKDLRIDVNGNPLSPGELSHVAQVTLTIHGDTQGVEVLVDGFEALPAVGPFPIGISLSPDTALVDEGQLISFTSQPYGGQPPYTLKWFVDGGLVQEGPTEEYTHFADVPGLHLISVTVIDSLFMTSTAEGSFTVLTLPPPPVPTRPLHVAGNKILNDLGERVHLHGANVPGWADCANGHWLDKTGVYRYGQSYPWTPQYVIDNMEGMQKWGCNVVRTHLAMELWMGNVDSFRAKYKEFLVICHDLGIYVVADFYSMRYFRQPGAGQTAIPYPPYLNAEEQAYADGIVGHPYTDQDYVDICADFAEAHKAFPNFIFETYNEPHGDQVAEESWMDVVQRIVNAIRARGVDCLIVYQWGYGQGAHYSAYPPTTENRDDWAGGLSWFFDYPITDPLNNLVVSTHIYRQYAGTGFAVTNYVNRKPFFSKADLVQVYTDNLLFAVAAQMPLFIGETGRAVNSTYQGPLGEDPDLADTEYWNNLLEMCNENGWHYAAWNFRPGGWSALVLGGVPGYAPTNGGQTLIEYMRRASAPIPLAESLLLAVVSAIAGALAVLWGLSPG